MINHSWAKLSVDGDDRWHSLIGHGADVAAVFQAFVEVPVLADRLTRAAGRALTPLDGARLGVLGFIHDFGKANRGFWGRQFAPGDQRWLGPAGHIRETAALFVHDPLVRTFSASFPIEEIIDWCGGEKALLAAVLSHHGRPVGRETLDDADGGRHARYWAADGAYDPMAELRRLGDEARRLFPEAFATGPALPDSPAFIHLFAGLLALADWMGSDAEQFPFDNGAASDRIASSARTARRLVGRRLDGRAARSALDPGRSFESAFAGRRPHPIQHACDRVHAERLTIIEAETGSGKTEAALWHFYRLFEAGMVDGLYFALPTRVAAREIHDRVTNAAKTLFGSRFAPVLAVPGYIRIGAVEGQALPHFKTLWPDAPDAENAIARWAAEKPRQFLTAPIAVGTIDQAFLGGLRVKHAHARAAALARSLLVVDEVHASDRYMEAVLLQLLANHFAVGGHALLMSATLGARAHSAYTATPLPPLETALRRPYPAITRGRALSAIEATRARKDVSVTLASLIAEPEAIGRMALDAALSGASVVVIRNLVADAVATTQAIEALAPPPGIAFAVEGIPTLHHGRFAAEDREKLDGAVTAAFGKGRSMAARILVGTQTLEQSLDIDADFLVTDLCPMDVLLQRIGRLHRHDRERPGAFMSPRLIVLVPAQRDLSPLMRQGAHGLGHVAEQPHGVYSEVLVLEATLRLLEADPLLRLPEMNRELVERATHPEARDAIAAEPGWARESELQTGLDFAQQGIAAGHRLDMTTDFATLAFPKADEEKVRTRLGEDRITFAFDPPARSPFGGTIAELAVPAWMIGQLDALPEVITVEPTAGGFRFAIGERAFSYDRFGLQKVAVAD